MISGAAIISWVAWRAYNKQLFVSYFIERTLNNMRSLYSKMCFGKRSMKYNTEIILSCKCPWDSKTSYWSSQQDKDPKGMPVFLFWLQWSNHVISGQGQLSLWLRFAITYESAWWCFVMNCVYLLRSVSHVNYSTEITRTAVKGNLHQALWNTFYFACNSPQIHLFHFISSKY